MNAIKRLRFSRRPIFPGGWLTYLARRAAAARRKDAARIADCGCRIDGVRVVECAKAEALGDDASRKFQSYHAAKGSPFEIVTFRTWDMARYRYVRHQQEARACIGITG